MGDNNKGRVNLLAEIYKSLGDPTRVAILLTLMQGETKVEDLAEATETSPSAVSRHLRVLRSLRVVKFRRQGRYVYYRLDDKHVKNILKEGWEHVELHH